MTPINFCYWLKGMFELMDPKELTEEQVACIKRHLYLVFTDVTTPQIGEKHFDGHVAVDRFLDLLKEVTPNTKYDPHTIPPRTQIYCRSDD